MKLNLVSAFVVAMALPTAVWAQATTAPDAQPQTGVPASTSPETSGQPAAPTVAAVPTKSLAVSRVTEMTLYDAKGDVIGEIDHVVADAAGQRSLVVSYGGLLGWGQSQVAVPLDVVRAKDDRLVTHELSVDQIKARPSWSRGEATDVAADQMLMVRT